MDCLHNRILFISVGGKNGNLCWILSNVEKDDDAM